MTADSLFVTVALAHLLAVSSPGPDFAIVVRQTLAHGRQAGIASALGIACGITAHVAWAMFGMGWVIQRWPLLVDLLQIAGALFLLWIGSRAIRARPLDPGAGVDATAPATTSLWRHYGVGLATNLLNGKALLFFVALCSTVITRDTPSGLRVALGAWMVLSTGAWFSFVAVTLGQPAIRRRLLASAHWIDRAMGLVLIGLGIAMLASLLLARL